MELASALESICYVVKCTTKTRPVTTTYKRMKVSFSKDKLDNLINKYTTMGEEEETGGGQDFEEEGDQVPDEPESPPPPPQPRTERGRFARVDYVVLPAPSVVAQAGADYRVH